MNRHGLKAIRWFVLLGALMRSDPAGAQTSANGPLSEGVPIRGWTILSDSEPDALAVIAAAPAYRINHLELSHEIVHDLRDIREAGRQGLVTRLTTAAHRAGIQEFVLWDHALYEGPC